MITLANFKNKLSQEGTADWSVKPALEFLWRYEMNATREEIWTYLSDTSRFNREVGFGKRNQTERDGKVIVTTSMVGFKQEWIEEPWTWLASQTITSTRNYIQGMAKRVYSVFHIDEDVKNNKRIVYLYFGWTPTHFLWNLFLRASSTIIENNFGKAFAKLDTHCINLKNSSEKAFRSPPPILPETAIKKLNEIKAELTKRNLSPQAINCLVDLVLTGDDLDLEPIKLRPLARNLSIDDQEILITSLHATRLGLFKLSWDLICPHCRGSRYSAESLGAIPEFSICEVCDVEFSSADENSIEVMFHIHPSIRKVEAVSFCAAEPAKKNHIRAQQLVTAKSTMRLQMHLAEGTYRARLARAKSEVTIEVRESHSQIELNLSDMNGESYNVRTNFNLQFQNEDNQSHLFVLENLLWESSALKPAHVLALPEFRDLFSEEHLNSNVKLFLGEQTILFTDIVGSTKFYSKVGDAKAFAEVRTHFQEVFAKVQANKGVIVKTIGDAVMAAFQSPIEGIQAAIEIQELFYESRKDSSIRLRISVHCGPVIAVHLNTGIDYFGNTVNYAAKIQAVARSNEVALSESVYAIYVKNFQQSYHFDIRQNQRDGGVPGDIYVLNIKSALQKPDEQPTHFEESCQKSRTTKL